MPASNSLHPDLQQMLLSKSVPNTLLLTGGEGALLEQEALSFASQLIGLSYRSSHPDLHIYRPEGKSQIHPLEQMQALIQEVFLPPFESLVKVFLITHAERMLPASSNALLKTLEEPPLDTYILLLTSAPQHLLPTILSRARKVTFGARGGDSPSNPLLVAILTATHPAERSEKIIELEKSLEPEEEEEGISYQQTDQILEQLLFWYRDAHLLASGGSVSSLFHAHSFQLIQNQKLIPLEKVVYLIEECRFALQQHIKLRNVLEYFFLSI